MSSSGTNSIHRATHEALSGGSTVNSSSEDVVSIPEDPQLESEYVEEEDDPLGVKKLALSFDYLLYKISEKMEVLAQQTESSVISRKDEAERELLDVETSANNLKDLIQKCDDLDNDFTMLEQISIIVSDFKQRIKNLELQIKNDGL